MDFKLEYNMLNEPNYFSKTYATLSMKEAQIKISKEQQDE